MRLEVDYRAEDFVFETRLLEGGEKAAAAASKRRGDGAAAHGDDTDVEDAVYHEV
jgi:hypothetical protein